MAILNYIRDITKYVMFDNQGGGGGLCLAHKSVSFPFKSSNFIMVFTSLGHSLQETSRPWKTWRIEHRDGASESMGWVQSANGRRLEKDVWWFVDYHTMLSMSTTTQKKSDQGSFMFLC